ncbi:MAG TPA: hypothetical protein P5205_05810 [Candidatus Paceibacterota bacterium]|nr:hypothetical protein [Verrucomicrobiota bacterium]HSA09869.1 hypothetical protein [Candidatus Paceibacterota bacterium]
MKTNRRLTGRDQWRTAGALARFIQEREQFTSEEFYQYARARGLTLKSVSKVIGNMLKGFSSAGVIAKTNRFKPSERNSAPMVVWQTAK